MLMIEWNFNGIFRHFGCSMLRSALSYRIFEMPASIHFLDGTVVRAGGPYVWLSGTGSNYCGGRQRKE